MRSVKSNSFTCGLLVWAVVVTVILGLGLAISTKARAQPATVTDEQVLALCRMDVLALLNGEKDWLKGMLPKMPANLRGRVTTSCKFYSQGLVDGLEISEKKVTHT